MPNEFYIPLPEDLAPQSQSNNQGREGWISAVDAALVIDLLEKHAQMSYGLYRALLNENGEAKSYGFSDEFPGIARELARMVLPLNNYTEWYWSINLHNLFHFLALRMDSHAQYEIQVYANAMYELIKPIVPAACEAFEDYKLYGANLSRMEINALNFVLADKANQANVLTALSNQVSKREVAEFKKKFKLD